MAAGGETLIDGEYNATYNSVACGMFEGDDGVPTLSYTSKGERINNTSRYGKTTIDAIYQGHDWEAMFRCEEYKAGSLGAFFPWSTVFGRLGVIGRLLYGMAAVLVFTSIAGTPAAGATPGETITANYAITPPDFNGRLLFGPTLRKVPVQMMLLPYGVDTASGIGAFSYT